MNRSLSLLFGFSVALMIFRGHSHGQTAAIAKVDHRHLNKVAVGSGDVNLDGTMDFAVTQIMSPSATGYVNVVADLNFDKQIGAYDPSSGGTQSEWIVQNVPLPITDEILSEPNLRIWFSLEDQSIPIPCMVMTSMIITDKPLTIPLPVKLDSLGSGWIKEADSLTKFTWSQPDGGGKDTNTVVLPDVAPLPPGSDIFEVPGTNDPKGMPDIAQKPQECGPTSAANSLIWLAKNNGFTDKLPKTPEGEVDTDGLILDLMEAMTGSRDRPFRGINAQKMVAGKKAWAEKMQLPIVVGGGMGDKNARNGHAFDFLRYGLRGKQDVELRFELPQKFNHWVTATGFATGGGRVHVYVHNPDDNKDGKDVFELKVDDKGNVTGDVIHPTDWFLLCAVSETYNAPTGVFGIGPSVRKRDPSLTVLRMGANSRLEFLAPESVVNPTNIYDTRGRYLFSGK